MYLWLNGLTYYTKEVKHKHIRNEITVVKLLIT